MTDDLQDIDLNALSDDELVEQMHNDLYDGMKDEIVEGTKILLSRGFSATKVLDDAPSQTRQLLLRPFPCETGVIPLTFSCDERGPRALQ